MSKLNHSRSQWLVFLVCAGGILLGCGHKEESAPVSQGDENLPASPNREPAEASLEQQTEQKLDPLTKDDVELYLKVMRAAAARVKALPPADKAALDGAEKILAGSASGKVPTMEDTKTLERANLVALYMDQIVAEEMNIDGRKYRGIAEAIEAVVPNPTQATSFERAETPVPDHAHSLLETRLNEVNAANEKFLEPYQGEIRTLIAVVRNLASLPK